MTLSLGDIFSIAAIGTTLYCFQNSLQLVSLTDAGHSSGKAFLAFGSHTSVSDIQATNFAVGSAAIGATISGNAGVAGATVSYSGTTSGSTTADGSGNYSFSVPNGTYTLTPSLLSYTFSPASAVETVSGSDITGVNFTATFVPQHYSVPDCRITPNASRTVNGTRIYDVQTSDNPAIPPTDSRTPGAPSTDGTYPQNSRAPGTFGPGVN